MRCRSMAFFFLWRISYAENSITISFFLYSIYLGKIKVNNLKRNEAIPEENSTVYFLFLKEYSGDLI